VIASTTVGVEFERAVGLGRLSDWVRMIAPRLTSLPPPKEPRNRAAIPSQVDVQQSYADKENRQHGEADDFGNNGQVTAVFPDLARGRVGDDAVGESAHHAPIGQAAQGLKLDLDVRSIW
jgi:hypothetical protein